MTLKWRKKGVFLLAAALAVFCFTGCSGDGEPQIIGEKQESDTDGQGVETDAPEGNTETTVREQVQAPERYQTEIEEEKMVLSADAPITMPDVETVVLGTSRSVNFTEEEYFQVKKALTDVLQIQWQEDQTELRHPVTEETPDPMGTSTAAVGESASGDEYNILYEIYEDGVAWANSFILIQNIENYGKSTKKQDINEIGEAMDGQPAGRGAELEEMAEKLLQAAGFEDFQLYRGRWQRSYYDLIGRSWSEAEYSITFTPEVGGIVCAIPDVSPLGNVYMKGPSINIIYRADGTLEMLRLIGKEDIQIQEGDAAGDFLLPFDAVQQLFEQYCRDFFSPESINSRVMQESLVGESFTTARANARAHIKVKNVKLEYIFLLPEDKTKKESELIPVWNFYGSIEKLLPSAGAGDDVATEYWTARHEPEGRILSIRADDGQILID